MTSAMTIIVYFFLGLTLLVLVAGIASMAIGGKFNKKYGNRLMMLRVAAQFAALLSLFLLYLLH